MKKLNTISLACVIAGMSILTIASTSSTEEKEANVRQNDRWVSMWERNRDYTLSVLDAMPEDKLGVSSKEGETRSFRQQMLHIAGSITFFNVVLIQGGQPPNGPEYEAQELNKEELKAELTKAYNDLASAVGKMSREDLDTIVKIPFFPNQPELTKNEILGFTKDHTAHHRGQTVTYLRLQGITPPAYVGF